MAKGKRGRPKKDPVLRDKGTPESQIRRMIIVNGGNPDKASDPLDALEERGIISFNMAKAGHDYASLYYKIFGTPFTHVNYDKLLQEADGFVQRTPHPSRNESESEWILSESFKVLRDIRARRTVDLIAIKKHFPNFLYEPKPHPSDNNFKNNLRDGLKALDQWFGKAKRSYYRIKKK